MKYLVTQELEALVYRFYEVDAESELEAIAKVKQGEGEYLDEEVVKDIDVFDVTAEENE